MLRILIEIMLATVATGSGAIMLYYFTPAWGLFGFFAGLILLVTGLAVAALALGKIHPWLEAFFGIATAVCGILVLFNPVPHWGSLGFLIGILVMFSGVAHAGQGFGGHNRNRHLGSLTFDHWSTPNRSTRIRTDQHNQNSFGEGADGE